MSLEEILTNLIENLSDFVWKTKEDLLNQANSFLYPLKESGEIVHYYFSAKEEEEEVRLTVFIQKDDQSSIESWELGISRDSEQE